MVNKMESVVESDVKRELEDKRRSLNELIEQLIISKIMVNLTMLLRIVSLVFLCLERVAM